MPHAMTEAFTVEESTAAPAGGTGDEPRRPTVRQLESETPNERAMRAATAARKAAGGQAGHPPSRQQG